MVGIRADSWQIKWFDAVEPTDGSERYYTIEFRNDDTHWRRYSLDWEPETGRLEGQAFRHRYEGQHDDLIFTRVALPKKMTLAMAHRAGIIPSGALNTKAYRPEYWTPVVKHTKLETFRR